MRKPKKVEPMVVRDLDMAVPVVAPVVAGVEKVAQVVVLVEQVMPGIEKVVEEMTMVDQVVAGMEKVAPVVVLVESVVAGIEKVALVVEEATMVVVVLAEQVVAGVEKVAMVVEEMTMVVVVLVEQAVAGTEKVDMVVAIRVFWEEEVVMVVGLVAAVWGCLMAAMAVAEVEVAGDEMGYCSNTLLDNVKLFSFLFYFFKFYVCLVGVKSLQGRDPLDLYRISFLFVLIDLMLKKNNLNLLQIWRNKCIS